MTRPYFPPIIPANEQEARVYHGNLALRAIEAATPLGETVLNSYHDREMLGMGMEKVVYPSIEKEDQVIAFYLKKYGEDDKDISIDQLKEKYYAIKLMHLLLPENIPNAHFAGADPPRMLLDKVNEQPIERDRFEELFKDLRGRAWALGVFLDPKHGNYLLDKDGKLKYVDDFGFQGDPKEIAKAITEIDDPAKRKAAFRYAERAGIKLASDSLGDQP